MCQGIRGQDGYDLGRLEGQKKSHCHWTIMKEGGGEGGVVEAADPTRDTVGNRSQVLLTPEFVH